MTLRTRWHDTLSRLSHPESFLGPLFTLASGTIVAHAITALTLLLLARLYTPADFGVLGLFGGIYFVLSTVACLRFDICIPLPSDDREAWSLLLLALISTLIVTSLSVVVIAVTPAAALESIGLEPLVPFRWILPVALFVTGIFLAFQSWATRQRDYRLIAKARVAQSAGASAAQVGLGAAGLGPVGLLLGLVINSSAGGLVLMLRLLGSRPEATRELRQADLVAALGRYSNFPRYSVPEALANSASIQLPLLLIGAMAGASELGFLTYAMAIIQAPMAIVGTSAAQVFLSQAPAKDREHQLHVFALRTIRNLLGTGVVPILVIGIAAPFVFPFIFGELWTRSGHLVLWMTPWFVFQFLASPMSMILNIVGRVRLSMFVQMGGLLLRSGAVMAAAMIANDRISEFYAISGALFYALVLAISLRIAKQRDAMHEPQPTGGAQ